MAIVVVLAAVEVLANAALAGSWSALDSDPDHPRLRLRQRFRQDGLAAVTEQVVRATSGAGKRRLPKLAPPLIYNLI